MSNQVSVIPKRSNFSLVKTKNDLVVNNSIVFVDTGLVFTLTAGKFYFIKLYPFVSSNAAADVKFRLIDIPVYTNGFWDTDFFKLDTALESNLTEGTTTGGEEVAPMFIMIKPTTSKTMKLQFAQNFAHASDTTLYKGSIALITEV